MGKREFIKYCNENLDLRSSEIDEALYYMDACRCPLRMAGGNIADRIRDLADDFEIENNLSDDWFDETFDDEDDVFWELDIFGKS